MNILTLNGSPMGNKGMTHILSENFLDGAREEGATARTVFLREKNISACRGCYDCWVKTPGHCSQDDDCAMLLDEVRKTDVLVIATPVYLDGMTAQMKLFIDRMVPLLSPHFQQIEGHCRHVARYEKLPRIVLVSVAGFPELDNFDGLIDHVSRICRNLHMEFAGSLVRPSCYVLSMEKALPGPVHKIKEAARRAGRELVRKGYLSAESRSAVAEQVFTKEAFIEQSNRFWDLCMAKGRWLLG